MNLFGHTAVALASRSDDAKFVLGAVLPDLVSMAHVRLDRSQLDGALLDGVDCHIAADAVFHDNVMFLEGARAIRADLSDAGLARGPARAIGHVGWELLLDGTLVGTPVQDACNEALALGSTVLSDVAVSDSSRWASFLAAWKSRGNARLRYDDVAWVAERLHAMLANRPRLWFGSTHVAAVERVLADHASDVADVADEVVAAVVAEMP